MRIERTIYFIITKNRPIEFYAGDGEFTENFGEGVLYFDFLDEAEDELNDFDEPEKYEIISGTVGVDV